MENDNKTPVRKFIEWIIGNTAWDYFKSIFSVISSLIGTWKIYVYPSVREWFLSMNIPLILVVIITFIGFLTIIWEVLSMMFRAYQWLKSKITTNDESTKIVCKIRKDGNEVYIDVKNTEWFIDITRISIRCHFLYKGAVVQDPLEWVEDSNKNGATFIARGKTKTIHFATIKPLDRLYNLHLQERDLEFQFSNDRSMELSVEGFSSAPIEMDNKRNIRGTLLIVESISKGIINFEIGVQHY